MPQENFLVRKTVSLCPVCLKAVGARVERRGQDVYLNKNCPVHGDFSLLLSCHSRYYEELSRFYFPLFRSRLPQRDYIVHLTNRCDLNCPICLADANSTAVMDYPKDRLKDFLRGKRGYKIDLMGAEPCLREDLADIIAMVKRSGNIAALHTNGLKIADHGYLKKLCDAGLAEVHLQFDGFDDEAYVKIRGRRLLEVKLKVLNNLRRLDISTDLVLTVVRGVNEDQMIKVVDYAAEHDFVKEVFFLGCRFLGRAKDLPMENCFMPDELIDILEGQSAGRIARENILNFQKVYFALLAAFSVRKCFYIHHFMLMREKGAWSGIDKFMDLKKAGRKMERFRELKVGGSILALPYLFFALAGGLILGGNLLKLRGVLSFALPFIRGFSLSSLSGRPLLLGFISACDAYSFDQEVARNCGKGALSLERGAQDIGALDNVLRDHCLRENDDESHSSG